MVTMSLMNVVLLIPCFTMGYTAHTLTHGRLRPTFSPSPGSSQLLAGLGDNVMSGGNDWKPEDGQMKSTDVGDYFPEDFDKEEQADMFKDGMMGSQGKGKGKQATERPGLEDLGEGGFIANAGIEAIEGIPEGTDFTPGFRNDDDFEFPVSSSGKPGVFDIAVKPFCMGFEDFYASFSPDSHPSFSVSPNVGRMDRRGGEISHFQVQCDPRGASGELKGTLVIILPEENEKLCYGITAAAR